MDPGNQKIGKERNTMQHNDNDFEEIINHNFKDNSTFRTDPPAPAPEILELIKNITPAERSHFLDYAKHVVQELENNVTDSESTGKYELIICYRKIVDMSSRRTLRTRFDDEEKVWEKIVETYDDNIWRAIGVLNVSVPPLLTPLALMNEKFSDIRENVSSLEDNIDWVNKQCIRLVIPFHVHLEEKDN